MAKAVAVAASVTAILAVPSNETPPIVRPVARAVAVAALPVVLPDDPEAFPVNGPVNPVAVSIPVPALYVTPASVFGARSPVADSNRPTKQVVSVVSATVMAVWAIVAPCRPVPCPEAAVRT